MNCEWVSHFTDPQGAAIFKIVVITIYKTQFADWLDFAPPRMPIGICPEQTISKAILNCFKSIFFVTLSL